MRYLLILLICISFIGCSHTIRRIGYKNTPVSKANLDCAIEFYREMPRDSTKYTVIGKIKLGDSGFSVNCQEDDALAILRNEGCAIGADAVNIVDETRANFWSTCYRAEALFIKWNNQVDTLQKSTEIIGNNDRSVYAYPTDSTNVKERVNQDKRKNMIIICTSFLTAMIFSFCMFRNN